MFPDSPFTEGDRHSPNRASSPLNLLQKKSFIAHSFTSSTTVIHSIPTFTTSTITSKLNSTPPLRQYIRTPPSSSVGGRCSAQPPCSVHARTCTNATTLCHLIFGNRFDKQYLRKDADHDLPSILVLSPPQQHWGIDSWNHFGISSRSDNSYANVLGNNNNIGGNCSSTSGSINLLCRTFINNINRLLLVDDDLHGIHIESVKSVKHAFKYVGKLYRTTNFKVSCSSNSCYTADTACNNISTSSTGSNRASNSTTSNNVSAGSCSSSSDNGSHIGSSSVGCPGNNNNNNVNCVTDSNSNNSNNSTGDSCSNGSSDNNVTGGSSGSSTKHGNGCSTSKSTSNGSSDSSDNSCNTNSDYIECSTDRGNSNMMYMSEEDMFVSVCDNISNDDNDVIFEFGVIKMKPPISVVNAVQHSTGASSINSNCISGESLMDIVIGGIYFVCDIEDMASIDRGCIYGVECLLYNRLNGYNIHEFNILFISHDYIKWYKICIYDYNIIKSLPSYMFCRARTTAPVGVAGVGVTGKMNCGKCKTDSYRCARITCDYCSDNASKGIHNDSNTRGTSSFCNSLIGGVHKWSRYNMFMSEFSRENMLNKYLATVIDYAKYHVGIVSLTSKNIAENTFLGRLQPSLTADGRMFWNRFDIFTLIAANAGSPTAIPSNSKHNEKDCVIVNIYEQLMNEADETTVSNVRSYMNIDGNDASIADITNICNYWAFWVCPLSCLPYCTCKHIYETAANTYIGLKLNINIIDNALIKNRGIYNKYNYGRYSNFHRNILSKEISDVDTDNDSGSLMGTLVLMLKGISIRDCIRVYGGWRFPRKFNASSQSLLSSSSLSSAHISLAVVLLLWQNIADDQLTCLNIADSAQWLINSTYQYENDIFNYYYENVVYIPQYNKFALTNLHYLSITKYKSAVTSVDSSNISSVKTSNAETDADFKSSSTCVDLSYGYFYKHKVYARTLYELLIYSCNLYHNIATVNCGSSSGDSKDDRGSPMAPYGGYSGFLMHAQKWQYSGNPTNDINCNYIKSKNTDRTDSGDTCISDYMCLLSHHLLVWICDIFSIDHSYEDAGYDGQPVFPGMADMYGVHNNHIAVNTDEAHHVDRSDNDADDKSDYNNDRLIMDKCLYLLVCKYIPLTIIIEALSLRRNNAEEAARLRLFHGSHIQNLMDNFEMATALTFSHNTSAPNDGIASTINALIGNCAKSSISEDIFSETKNSSANVFKTSRCSNINSSKSRCKCEDCYQYNNYLVVADKYAYDILLLMKNLKQPNVKLQLE